MKKTHSILGLSTLLLGMLASVVLADTAEFRLVVSSNANVVAGRFAADLEIKGTATRTLNSLTVDVTYGSQLVPATVPGENWFAGSIDYETSVSKISLPTNHYRVLVTGNKIGKTSAGVPAGFPVTANWQRVVTLCWDIAAVSTSYPLDLANNTVAAAFFDNAANLPLADLTEWEPSAVHGADLKLAAKIFLQGPYDAAANQMTTTLNPAFLPKTSPYSADPRNLDPLPAGVTDWVLLQLRSSATGPVITSKSVLLAANGNLVGDNGVTAELSLYSLEGSKNYYIIVRHRNHLGVMSANGVALKSESPAIPYDFTTSASKFYGNDAALLEPGVYGMFAGDADGNGYIQTSDKNNVWLVEVGKSGYLVSDWNLNGFSQTSDKNMFWLVNVGKMSLVP